MRNLSTRILWVAITLCAVVLVDTARSAFAHPAPSVIHDYIVSLKPSALTVQSYLRVSPELVPEVYRQIDTDGNGRTSEAERDVWFREHPSKLGITLDGVVATPTMSVSSKMEQADLLVSSQRAITVTYTLVLPSPVSGKHRIKLTYGDNYLSYDEYYISVAGDVINDGQPVGVSRPEYPATFQIVYQMPESEMAGNVPMGELAPAPWTLGVNQPQGATGQAPTSPTTGVSSGQVLDMLRTWKGEVWSGMLMLALALVLGAVHAVTPGHGKAMVAAYLIGSRGRVRDAVILGGVVTVTHTAGVIIMGLILLLIPLPRAVQPGLQLLSGALVLMLGVYLLVKRWSAMRAGRVQQSPVTATELRNPVKNGTKVEGDRDTSWRVTADYRRGTTSLPVRRALAAQPVLAGALQVNNTQAMENSMPDHYSNGHAHYEDHEHGDLHEHGGRPHSHAPVNTPDSVRAMIGLGISGGLVPCPDALAILLLAVSVGQFALGLGLVLSFSFGLAIVLIVIGIALIKLKGVVGRGRASQVTSNPIWTKWVPLGSAAVVVAIGVMMVITSLGAKWG